MPEPASPIEAAPPPRPDDSSLIPPPPVTAMMSATLFGAKAGLGAGALAHLLRSERRD